MPRQSGIFGTFYFMYWTSEYRLLWLMFFMLGSFFSVWYLAQYRCYPPEEH